MASNMQYLSVKILKILIPIYIVYNNDPQSVRQSVSERFLSAKKNSIKIATKYF